MSFTALLVGEEDDLRRRLANILREEGFDTMEIGDLSSARAAIAGSPPDVAFVEQRLRDGDGRALIEDEKLRGRTEFVLLNGECEEDVERLGGIECLPRPIDRRRLRTILSKVRRTHELSGEVSTLRGTLRTLGRFGVLVGRSSAMHELYELIARVAPTQASVFITGESGTGKELVAQTVHDLSPRRGRPFLALNCGAMAASVIESEIFGHERGSFTGADKQRKGFFEQAEGGTLFLDEITEMSPDLQVKFLRVLETGTLMRVGGDKPIPVDVRIIAACNRVPEDALKEGVLREDLFYRLNVFRIRVPSLRERENDVELLAESFLEEINAREGGKKRWSPAAMRQLRALGWPGNVRELKNVVQSAYIMAEEDVIDVAELPHAAGAGIFAETQGAAPAAAPPASAASPASPSAAAAPISGPVPTPAPSVGGGPGGETLHIPVGAKLADVERVVILATLEKLKGRKKETAAQLGISVKTLYNRLSVYRAEKDRGGAQVESASE